MKLKKGDQVTFADPTFPKWGIGTILSVDGLNAFVKWNNGPQTAVLCELETLERAETPVQPETEGPPMETA
jgi:hypothetical protein